MNWDQIFEDMMRVLLIIIMLCIVLVMIGLMVFCGVALVDYIQNGQQPA